MKTLIAIVLAIGLVGCTQTPTQRTGVVDDRPRLAFEEQLPGDAKDYDVLIDGISYGPMSQYLANENALRVIPGSHQIEIKDGSKTVFTTKVFLGASSTRIITVTDYE